MDAFDEKIAFDQFIAGLPKITALILKNKGRVPENILGFAIMSFDARLTRLRGQRVAKV